MKKQIIAVLLAITGLNVPFTASCQVISNSTIEQQTSLINQKREMAFAVAPIKSASDLKNFLIMTPKKQSPLKYLSPQAHRRFVESLTFNENGLTGFNFMVLKENLSPSQIDKILSLFGAQHLTPVISAKVENNSGPAAIQSQHLNPSQKNNFSSGGWPKLYDDHKGYYCSGRATCNESSTQICMSGC
jgi:hypothetical protein